VDVFAWTKREVRQFIYWTFILDIATEGVTVTKGEIRFGERPVVITRFEPKERKY